MAGGVCISPSRRSGSGSEGIGECVDIPRREVFSLSLCRQAQQRIVRPAAGMRSSRHRKMHPSKRCVQQQCVVNITGILGGGNAGAAAQQVQACEKQERIAGRSHPQRVALVTVVGNTG